MFIVWILLKIHVVFAEIFQVQGNTDTAMSGNESARMQMGIQGTRLCAKSTQLCLSQNLQGTQLCTERTQSCLLWKTCKISEAHSCAYLVHSHACEQFLHDPVAHSLVHLGTQLCLRVYLKFLGAHTRISQSI